MQQLRWGMVGGGQGAFIGDVHRMAARLDGGYQLVAGCFSSNVERSAASGQELNIVEERNYRDYIQMAEQEAVRPDGIEVVSVVTPNYLHFDVVKTFLAQGIAVICEKPLAVSLQQALDLRDLAQKQGTFLCVTYNYVENPMVQVARELVQSGDLGELQVVDAQYLQDWLATDIEKDGQKQASWRTDPAQAGPAGCLGDIAIHAYNLVSYISGQQADRVSARLSTFVPGRRVDDHVDIRLDYQERPLQGRVMVSQIMAGHENDLSVRIAGSKASLEWRQEEPNKLLVRRLGGPTEIITRNGGGYPASLAALCRIPAGHPEGYLEAFANVYKRIRSALQGLEKGEYPNIHQAVHDMAFVEVCLTSNANTQNWETIQP